MRRKEMGFSWPAVLRSTLIIKNRCTTKYNFREQMYVVRKLSCCLKI